MLASAGSPVALKVTLRRFLKIAAGLGWLFLLMVALFGVIKAERFSDAEAVFIAFDNQTGQDIRRVEIGGNYRYTVTTGAIAAGQRSAPTRVKNVAVRFTRIFVSFDGDYARVKGIPDALPASRVVFVLRKGERSHELAVTVSADTPSNPPHE